MLFTTSLRRCRHRASDDLSRFHFGKVISGKLKKTFSASAHHTERAGKNRRMLPAIIPRDQVGKVAVMRIFGPERSSKISTGMPCSAATARMLLMRSLTESFWVIAFPWLHIGAGNIHASLQQLGEIFLGFRSGTDSGNDFCFSGSSRHNVYKIALVLMKKAL